MFAVFTVVLLAVVWLLPFFVILGSKKTSGKEKLAWVLGVIFVSWFAWIFYLLLAPISKNKKAE
ncbi:MAG TPA: hypothetical protein VK076_03755 [Candidatus Sphingobacterium stercoripullorum]|nr:hypothetical protein [Candidatus Sphingobacterium stercoripullorum]